MTIDESITELAKARDSIEPCLFIDEALDQSMKTAIEIMRKYKKIEQIVKDIPYGGEATVRRIQEVIEDGDDT